MASDIEEDYMAILRLPTMPGGPEEFYTAELYSISSNLVRRVKRSTLISSKEHGTCQEIKVMTSSAKVLVLGVWREKGHDTRILMTEFSCDLGCDSEYLTETSIRQLEPVPGFQWTKPNITFKAGKYQNK